VAARLAASTQGDEVLLGIGTRERLGSEFPFDALGERGLRNVEAPVRVFRLAPPAPARAVPA
jgi:class 3 adenylate cyclase